MTVERSKRRFLIPLVFITSVIYPLNSAIHILNNWGLGPVSRNPENLSGPKSQLYNCNPLVLKRCSFNMSLMERKNKRIAKFAGLELRIQRCKDIKGICGTRNKPEKFRDWPLVYLKRWTY